MKSIIYAAMAVGYVVLILLVFFKPDISGVFAGLMLFCALLFRGINRVRLAQGKLDYDTLSTLSALWGLGALVLAVLLWIFHPSMFK